MAERSDNEFPAAQRTGTVGGVVVVGIGIVLMFVWSFWIGLIVTLLGLVGVVVFVRGRWTSS
jgi:hypothetical protein